MSQTARIAVAVVAVVILVIVGWLVFRDGGEEATPLPAPTVAAVPATPTPTLADQLSDRLRGVTLGTSDAVIRELAAELSARPELAKWLASDDLVRRFVAAVNNVAEGTSPKTHVEFLRPSEPFRVEERGDRLYVDPTSWARYDVLADVITSLDTDGTVALYRELEPLMVGAHREIAPPNVTFREQLDTTFAALLAVPVPEGPVEVEPKVVTYTYSDASLEGLSAAQRQFLRMGPDNVRRVQEKLREIRAELERVEDADAAEVVE
jgi:hypothetical protein